MDYLEKYGITKSKLKEIENNNLDFVYINLKVYKEKVEENLKYLISKGFDNIFNLLMSRMDILFVDNADLVKSFESRNGIVMLLNEDIDNFDLIGY